MVDADRKKVAALVIALAREDPYLTKEMIAKLRERGDVEVNELDYLDRIADKWIKIARDNAKLGGKS